MNIIAICGSPREGNTEFTLKRILTKAEEFGASSELVLLREKRIEFCDGCLSCSSTGKCKIRDDMQLIYPKLEEADLIIFGSPTYFDCVTGLMKNFLDRLHSNYKKVLKDKKFVFITVGQADMESLNKTIKYVENFADIVKMFMVGDLGLIAKNPQDIENDPDKIKKIDEFTEGLIG
ncbi:MAG: flavodoxin family protein [Candidatus Pacebacteria bacterium]|nr:flavodoxin family protein [Candidatus Paceibacterota bacterium]